jgi:hypothetical protein
MRAALARRGKSGGSSDPAPAAAAGVVTWVAEEKGRSQWDPDEGSLDRGCAARRSLGMVEAAAESMPVARRRSLLASGPAEEIGFGSSTPIREEERRRRRLAIFPARPKKCSRCREPGLARQFGLLWSPSSHFGARCLGQTTLFLIWAKISWADYRSER